jgi:Zn-dependent M28 family amino/carboxypeptidase
MFESVDLASRPNWKLRVTCIAIAIVLVAAVIWLLRMTQMPLKSYAGPLDPLTANEVAIRDHLSSDVKYLSVTIGERSMEKHGSLKATTAYLRDELQRAGYTVADSSYQVQGQQVSNLEAVLVGSELPQQTVVIGAHYDSVAGTVGANDNATGVAATLELARLLKASKLRRTVRFAFFVNEEPPYFQTETMGSRIYARKLRSDSTQVSAMISLETIGYYSDEPGSQKYPPVLNLLYPNRGNFIGFVANSESRDLVRRCVRNFRQSTRFPSEGIAAPAEWPGIGWSDQWSFWQEGYPGIMITDTAVYRYPYYHTVSDTFDKIDYDKAARVVQGVDKLVEMLANER